MRKRVTQRLFSYGTLQLADVQREVFGGPIAGEPDAIVGYRVAQLTITDPDVIRASGSDQHPVLIPTDDPQAAIEGTSYTVSETQLEAADAYEVDDYVRKLVPLRSA